MIMQITSWLKNFEVIIFVSYVTIILVVWERTKIFDCSISDDLKTYEGSVRESPNSTEKSNQTTPICVSCLVSPRERNENNYCLQFISDCSEVQKNNLKFA